MALSHDRRGAHRRCAASEPLNRRAMTADVTPDRRVTVPILGIHTAFVDGSRLSWALPSPVHERLGYRVLVPDRIQGDAVLPHSSFTAQSRITSRRSCANRPDPPASRRARHRQGMVWPRWSLRQIAERRPALTMAARGAPAGSRSGRRNPLGRTKKLMHLQTRVPCNPCLLTLSLIQGWVEPFAKPIVAATANDGFREGLNPSYEPAIA